MLITICSAAAQAASSSPGTFQYTLRYTGRKQDVREFENLILRINQDIDKLIKEVEQTMPKDIRIVTFDNTNDFLFASIREVVFTLLLAIVLVLVVVYLSALCAMILKPRKE